MRKLKEYISTIERLSSVDDYINEKFQVGKGYMRQYAYTPKNKTELIYCIKEKVKKEGLGTEAKPLDLNDIDTSKITDMNALFSAYSYFNCDFIELTKKGRFDISDWDVSNVKTMELMFGYSAFDGDLSDWDVSNVKNMYNMFAYSDFTGKNGSISNWNTHNVENMGNMFRGSLFDGDVSNWDISSLGNVDGMFMQSDCIKIPKWYYKFKTHY